MISEPSAATRQVATKTASLGIPASPRIAGLTKMMYAIVRKVVKPASSSVRRLVPASSKPKYRFTESIRRVSDRDEVACCGDRQAPTLLTTADAREALRADCSHD